MAAASTVTAGAQVWDYVAGAKCELTRLAQALLSPQRAEEEAEAQEVSVICPRSDAGKSQS